ncbi:MAG: hypothetical protein KGH61_01850 [Candidatus Micrarchaeota archaeon]|nr:hypothetical protein [Candidatus Micrarchaeota archaeon]MDE1847674.1 hypothetical protein [Candidatus Micrarchaeota archaeon]MDE1864495.1 hypothetical protein [Candidatus Micrarchaeota archaeon]
MKDGRFKGLVEPIPRSVLLMPFYEKKARDTFKELQHPSNATKKAIMLETWHAGGRIYYTSLEEILKQKDPTLTSEAIKEQVKELVRDRLLWGAIGKGGMVFLTDGPGKEVMIFFDEKRE